MSRAGWVRSGQVVRRHGAAACAIVMACMHGARRMAHSAWRMVVAAHAMPCHAASERSVSPFLRRGGQHYACVGTCWASSPLTRQSDGSAAALLGPIPGATSPSLSLPLAHGCMRGAPAPACPCKRSTKATGPSLPDS